MTLPVKEILNTAEYWSSTLYTGYNEVSAYRSKIFVHCLGFCVRPIYFITTKLKKLGNLGLKPAFDV